MRTRTCLLLCATLALGTTVAAQEDRSLNATLLVRCGPGDLVLNADLLAAIAQDPEVEAGVRKVAGTGLSSYGGIGVSLPAAHLAGTYQVLLGIDLHGSGDWSRETKDKIVDVVAAHLQKRLGAMLFEEPMRALSQRRDELAERHAKLLSEHAALRARAARADTEAEAVHKLREALEQQALTTRLELATEQRANEYLEKLRAEHSARRDALRRERDPIDRQQERMQIELTLMDNRISSYPGNGTNEQQAELKALRDQFTVLQAKVKEQQSNQQRINLAINEVEEVLVRTLEQLPASTLALQRARARLDSLEVERKELDAREAGWTAARAEAVQFAARAEQLQIDITVCRTLLTEVQGKLGRLEPVRYELLRQG